MPKRMCRLDSWCSLKTHRKTPLDYAGRHYDKPPSAGTKTISPGIVWHPA
jgi:hypothetical protein